MGTAASAVPPSEARRLGTDAAEANLDSACSELRSIIKTVNLKSDMPQVQEALQRLAKELTLARQQKHAVLKIIHGYGSTGAGGDIRIAVQKRLHEMSQDGHIRGCIFGESWSKSDDQTWTLLQAQPELKSDADLGRRNQGITVVLL